MPRWVIEVLVVYLVVAIALSQAHAADKCDALTMRAYDCQFDRQHGTRCTWEPKTQLEEAMYNAVWGQPQFFKESKRQTRAAEFAREWKDACLKGEYR